MMRHLYLKTFVTAAVMAGGAIAHGAIIAQDSYITGTGEYTPGIGVGGQTGTSPIGFTGSWNQGSANLQFEAGGILDGDSAAGNPSNGQGKYIAAGSSAYRRIFRTIAPVIAPPNNTFYMSHLLNSGQSGGAPNQYALVGFGSDVVQATIEGAGNNLLGAFAGFKGNATGNVDLIIRYRNGAAAGSIADAVLVPNAANTTYRVVMALEYNNPGDEIRYWVNPTVFNSEASMTASAAASGTLPGFQLGGLVDLNRLTIGTNYSNRSFFWDESILASAVSDLGPVPEPTTVALASLAFAGVLAARRRWS